MRRLLLVGLVLLALGAAPSASTSPDAASWIRRELQHFIVWVPDNSWNTVNSTNGVDITSALGELNVSAGFSGWPYPLTIKDIVDYGLKTGGFDAHPLSNAKLTPQGPAHPFGKGTTRQIFNLSGYRTDRKERVRGVVTIDVFNFPATGVYGYDAYTRVAPVTQWQRVAGTLLYIQKHITYKPKTPTCVRWEPGCPLRR